MTRDTVSPGKSWCALAVAGAVLVAVTACGDGESSMAMNPGTGDSPEGGRLRAAAKVHTTVDRQVAEAAELGPGTHEGAHGGAVVVQPTRAKTAGGVYLVIHFHDYSADGELFYHGHVKCRADEEDGMDCEGELRVRRSDRGVEHVELQEGVFDLDDGFTVTVELNEHTGGNGRSKYDRGRRRGPPDEIGSLGAEHAQHQFHARGRGARVRRGDRGNHLAGDQDADHGEESDYLDEVDHDGEDDDDQADDDTDDTEEEDVDDVDDDGDDRADDDAEDTEEEDADDVDDEDEDDDADSDD